MFARALFLLGKECFWHLPLILNAIFSLFFVIVRLLSQFKFGSYSTIIYSWNWFFSKANIKHRWTWFEKTWFKIQLYVHLINFRQNIHTFIFLSIKQSIVYVRSPSISTAYVIYDPRHNPNVFLSVVVFICNFYSMLYIVYRWYTRDT